MSRAARGASRSSATTSSATQSRVCTSATPSSCPTDPSADVRRDGGAVAWRVVMDVVANPVERVAAVLAPDFVGVDHRHLSNWSLHGADAYIEHMRALREVADDIEFRQLEVVALAPSAQLVCASCTRAPSARRRRLRAALPRRSS